MTTRTWIGGGNNNASNAKDWSPTGVPQLGDTLDMTSGTTINIKGNDLADDQLLLYGSGTINLLNATAISHVDSYGNPGIGLFVGGSARINMAGSDTATLLSGGPSDVSVYFAPNATWTGGLEELGTLTVNGDRQSNFVNTGIADNPSVIQGHATINVAVAGTGNFYVYGGVLGEATSTLQFGSSVGTAQTVSLVGVSPGPNDPLMSKPVLVIDRPNEFHATVVLFNAEPASEEDIDLNGLAKADSYTFKNDMLSIYSGHSVIDVLRLDDWTSYGFAVEKVGNSVDIIGLSNPTTLPTAGPLLPLHT